MHETIHLEWHGPYRINNVSFCDEDFDKCIYSISRKWGNNETLLYIGRTKRSLRQRIKEHAYWLEEARGIYIRFGGIELLPNQKSSEKRFADTESLLITVHQPPENTQNRKYYYGRKELAIISSGRRGQILKYVSTDDLPWG